MILLREIPAQIYQKILSGTPRIAEFIELNEDYAMSQNQLVTHFSTAPNFPVGEFINTIKEWMVVFREADTRNFKNISYNV
jgi:hypothetical protein